MISLVVKVQTQQVSHFSQCKLERKLQHGAKIKKGSAEGQGEEKWHVTNSRGLKKE